MQQRDRTTNLTQEQSSFHGRSTALGDVATLFADGASLVTLLGPAGQGKTRLARRYALSQISHYERDGGVWFCPLANAHSRSQAIALIAAQLGVPLTADTDNVVQLGKAIANRGRVLILLDNFEQISEEAPNTLGVWLQQAPNACFLVTSRHRLGLEGEYCHEIPPLAPEAACALFRARAKQVQTHLASTPDDAHTIEKIVETLDGNPLSIELAAARAGMLTPAVILQRLDQRFQLLRSERRDIEARHSTLANAIDWSWQLLEPSERTLLAKCVVFRGGFTLDAAEFVLAEAGEDAIATLDSIQALMNRSLIRALPPTEERPSHRFILFESIRQFAGLKLDELGIRSQVEAAHFNYFVTFGSKAAEMATTRSDCHDGIQMLRQERGNLIAAFECALVADSATAVQLVLALEPLMATSGPFVLWLDCLRQAQQAAGTTENPVAMAKIMRAIGDALRRVGRIEEARELLQEARTLAHQAGEIGLEGKLLHLLCHCDLFQGDSHKTVEGFKEVAELCKAGGEPGAAALALSMVAILCADSKIMTQARALAGESRDPRSIMGQLSNDGHFARDSGELEDSRARLEEAWSLARDLSDRASEGIILSNLGRTLHLLGKVGEARQRLEKALTYQQMVNDTRFGGFTRAWLGALELEAGRHDVANEHLTRAVALAEQHGDRWAQARPTAYLALLEARLGHCSRAEERLLQCQEMVGSEVDTGGFAEALLLFECAVAVLDSRRDTASEIEKATHLLSQANDSKRPRPLSADALFAARFLEKILLSGGTVIGDHANSLVVHRSEEWLQPPGGNRIELSSNLALWRVVLRLVDERLDEPGSAVSLDDLATAGWPDEQILARAASNRVYNAIATLRRRGLKDCLFTRNDGYLLDPEIPVSRR